MSYMKNLLVDQQEDQIIIGQDPHNGAPIYETGPIQRDFDYECSSIVYGTSFDGFKNLTTEKQAALMALYAKQYEGEDRGLFLVEDISMTDAVLDTIIEASDILSGNDSPQDKNTQVGYIAVQLLERLTGGLLANSNTKYITEYMEGASVHAEHCYVGHVPTDRQKYTEFVVQNVIYPADETTQSPNSITVEYDVNDYPSIDEEPYL